jgi:hypothetical protein
MTENRDDSPHHPGLHEYAKARGLEYAWEGTDAFDKMLRTLSPGQYEIFAVHTHEGITRVLLFSTEL